MTDASENVKICHLLGWEDDGSEAYLFDKHHNGFFSETALEILKYAEVQNLTFYQTRITYELIPFHLTMEPELIAYKYILVHGNIVMGFDDIMEAAKEANSTKYFTVISRGLCFVFSAIPRTVDRINPLDDVPISDTYVI